MRHGLYHGLFMREFGRDRGARTMLWIHGLGESGLCFERVLEDPRLAGWRHLVPDLPGYGRTAWPHQPHRFFDLVELLGDIVSDLVGEPVVIAGHSMGGVLALLFAERYPSLVRAYLDIDGNTSPGDCVFSGQAAALDLDEFVATGFDALRDRVYAAGVEHPAQRGYHASLKLAQPESFHQHAQELVTLSRPGDLAARRAALECPSVYVAGAPGGACAESRRLLDAARVPVIEISPSGHWPFLDRPGPFVQVAATFLNNLR